MYFVKSFDSEKIAYQIFHQPKNATTQLLIIPGLGGDLNFFIPTINQLLKLEPDLAIIALIPRGHSFSSRKFPPGYQSTIAVQALDVLALVKALKLKRFILLGHSIGGLIVQNYLNLPKAPAPAKIFLVCTAPRIFGFPAWRKIAYRLLAHLPESKNHYHQQPPEFYHSFHRCWDIDLRRWWFDTRVLGGVLYWLLNFLALSGWQNPNPERINQKTTYYLYGKTDIIIPRLIQKRNVKHLSQLTGIELNCGHLPPLTNPIGLAQTIAKNL